jgi:hypothetical protein
MAKQVPRIFFFNAPLQLGAAQLLPPLSARCCAASAVAGAQFREEALAVAHLALIPFAKYKNAAQKSGDNCFLDFGLLGRALKTIKDWR